MLDLYQFPISHFCEKVCWALDYKRIEYRVHNLVPGPHRRTVQRFASRSSVPLVRDGDTAVQGSAEIITWLDKRYPDRPLTPTNTTDASLACEWERSADNSIGVPLRVVVYHYVLEDRRLATRLLTADCAWWSGPLYAVMFPTVRRAMRARMKINAASAAAAEQQFERALGFVEQRLTGRRFLAGPLFSRADLAVSALLAPAWRDIPDLPAPLAELIAKYRQRPALQWAHAIYSEYRR